MGNGEGNIVMPAWVVKFLAPLMIAAMLGAYGWIWKTEGKTIRLETQLENLKESSGAAVARIEKKVDKIYDLMLEEARHGP
jgi:hypothetical protein